MKRTIVAAAALVLLAGCGAQPAAAPVTVVSTVSVTATATATATVTAVRTVERTVTATAKALADGMANGDYVIGKDIVVGTYQCTKANDDTLWSLNDKGGEIVGGDVGSVAQITTAPTLGTAYSAKLYGCDAGWIRVD
jgi:hypothetical protein